MYWVYGSHTSETNDSLIASYTEVVRNSAGEMMERKFRHEVMGYLSADGATVAIIQAAMKVKMDALLLDMSLQNRDFIFYMDDGNPSSTYLYNSGSISGVKVVAGPDFIGTTGNERGTQAKFKFAVEASYPLTGAPKYLDFHEKLTFSGGGPVFTVRDAIIGPPQRQRVKEQSTWFVTQEGSLEGYLSAVAAPPPPIWPGALIRNPQISRDSPDRRGKGHTKFPLSWRYEFASVFQLFGVPHLWV